VVWCLFPCTLPPSCRPSALPQVWEAIRRCEGSTQQREGQDSGAPGGCIPGAVLPRAPGGGRTHAVSCMGIPDACSSPRQAQEAGWSTRRVSLDSTGSNTSVTGTRVGCCSPALAHTTLGAERQGQGRSLRCCIPTAAESRCIARPGQTTTQQSMARLGAGTGSSINQEPAHQTPLPIKPQQAFAGCLTQSSTGTLGTKSHTHHQPGSCAPTRPPQVSQDIRRKNPPVAGGACCDMHHALPCVHTRGCHQ
jgi:hypothetical protein